jgi:hypothetical protein
LDDLIGILIFLVIAGLSWLSKAAQRQREEQPRPKWPGPVAAPRNQGWPPKPAPVWPDRTERQGATEGARTEGTRTEGFPSEGLSVEGPKERLEEAPPLADTVQEELRRFDAETAALSRRHLEQLQDDLEPQEYDWSLPREERQAVRHLLTDRESLVRAVLAAEILGKPRALRGRNRR